MLGICLGLRGLKHDRKPMLYSWLPPSKAHNNARPGFLLQPAGQRHGQGGDTKQRCKFATAVGGNLIRENADQLAAP